MNAAEQISLYENLVYVSLVVAIVGLGFAIFFFFYFKIPVVFALMTGSAKRETLQRMEQQNAKTGKLRSAHTGPTGSGSRKASVTLPKTADLNVAPTTPMQQTAAAVNGADTAVLGMGDTSVLGMGDTSVLGMGETSVLGMGETSVLGGAAATPERGETAVLNDRQTGIPPMATQEFNGDTVILSSSDAAVRSFSIRFDLTESTMVIHTDELI